MEQKEEPGTEEDVIFELAIEYVLGNGYPSDLVKDRKRAMRKRAATLTAEQGEVFVQRKGRRVNIVTSVEEQRFILKACYSDPTSSHFGLTKTWQRVSERFYWNGLALETRDEH